jgi:LCP family protein required for cell wall assembly
MPVGGDPGPWGPLRQGGHRWPLLRRFAKLAGIVSLVGLVALVSTGFELYRQLESSLTRVSLDQLDGATEATDARHFLVVGSDSRGDLDEASRSELALGDFEGQRSDTIIYVALSADRSDVAVVSFPRDLLVMDNGRQRKLTDTFAAGADDLIRVIQDNFGLPINHYAKISLAGFVEVVRTVGGVDICLDEPLDDWRAGADFEAGCHRMSAEEALAYVRSRKGPRADFERIDRQQTFLRATIEELTQRRVLTNVPQLFQLVEDVSSNVVTDDGLGLGQMRGLADEARQIVSGGVPMTTVPAYTRRIDGIDYVIAYRPGAQALFEDLRQGRPLAERGTSDERRDTRVAVWSGGRSGGTKIVGDTLLYAAFDAVPSGPGPEGTDAGSTTVVYRVPGETEAADWVAATLGAPVRALPSGVDVPNGADVVVAVGDDAQGS